MEIYKLATIFIRPKQIVVSDYVRKFCALNFKSLVFLDYETNFSRSGTHIFIGNLYWDGQIAKKLSGLKPQRLRTL